MAEMASIFARRDSLAEQEAQQSPGRTINRIR